MTITSQAVMETARALIEWSTWADDRIMISPMNPIDEMLRQNGDKQKPWVALYVEDTKAMYSGKDSSGYGADLNLKIFIYVAPGLTELPDGYSVELDGKSAGLTLNFMARQIEKALHMADTDWQKLWNILVLNIDSRTAQFIMAEIEDGVRIPCMELSYTMNVVPDPQLGKDLYGPWVMLDTLLRTYTEGVALADLFKEMIEGPTGLTDYEIFQRQFGLSDAAHDASGLDLVDGAEPDVLLEDIDVVDP